MNSAGGYDDVSAISVGSCVRRRRTFRAALSSDRRRCEYLIPNNT